MNDTVSVVLPVALPHLGSEAGCAVGTDSLRPSRVELMTPGVRGLRQLERVPSLGSCTRCCVKRTAIYEISYPFTYRQLRRVQAPLPIVQWPSSVVTTGLSLMPGRMLSPSLHSTSLKKSNRIFLQDNAVETTPWTKLMVC
jgi:hypothetical protein